MDRDDVIALYDRLIAPHEGIARKGKTTAYTATGGNMFSFVDPSGRFCLRLSEADRADWARDWPDDPVLQYGSVMKGYVLVPDALLANEAALGDWFARSVTHARGLRQKPTTRKKQN
ncbi:MAG: hypothetical protein QNJ13_02300 [Paracoccaceae bacterium]|nr:hypothetical protein [Paracoccaceae bacterium]